MKLLQNNSLQALLVSLVYLLAPSGLSAQSLNGPTNMGPIINTEARDAEPTFTADGKTMYFNCFDRQGRVGGDICVSNLVDNQWSEPTIVEAVSSEYAEVEPLLSPDGKQLYILSTRPGGHGEGDIWVSNLIDGEWTEPENLDAPINSPYNDHCLYFAGENWEFAYWTSTRPGGFGGNDIWMSEKIDGVWGEAVNLGENVNTAGVEHHSLPSEDGRSLYVTAVRDEGFGGQDIYVTTRDENGVWGKLINLGSAVNSEAQDRCPAFSPDHSLFYFDSTRKGGYGSLDLWYISYSEIEHIR
ncbi:MAG: hypothetical protein COA96_06925 [SAR86 cluster bacterium]|uniref:Uncharacterized protein n=1 Tax=SAR86 cluster bacterium TaxID=2030880 RepID=A0A2A5B2J7_9GAMM|nr:MAG: hypothetical protein COA96_06925 [SAR86 cluster bacterium]